MGDAPSEPMTASKPQSRAQTWLTVDQGNTSTDAVWLSCAEPPRVLRTWRGVEDWNGVAESIQVTLAADESDAQGGALAASDWPAGVSISSVRGAKRDTLKIDLMRHFEAVLEPQCGLELDLETPETTGRDRLFAARAARALSAARAVIVIDAGTAMTVDLVLDERFCGGAIAPGAWSLARCLAERGAQLFEIEPRVGVGALGRSSRAALEAGVVVGLRGAAIELSRGLIGVAHEQLGADVACDIVVTGGDRELLLAPTTIAHERLSVAQVWELPLAVPLGLYLASFPGAVLPDGSGVSR